MLRGSQVTQGQALKCRQEPALGTLLERLTEDLCREIHLSRDFLVPRQDMLWVVCRPTSIQSAGVPQTFHSQRLNCMGTWRAGTLERKGFLSLSVATLTP